MGLHELGQDLSVQEEIGHGYQECRQRLRWLGSRYRTLRLFNGGGCSKWLVQRSAVFELLFSQLGRREVFMMGARGRPATVRGSPWISITISKHAASLYPRPSRYGCVEPRGKYATCRELVRRPYKLASSATSSPYLSSLETYVLDHAHCMVQQGRLGIPCAVCSRQAEHTLCCVLCMRPAHVVLPWSCRA